MSSLMKFNFSYFGHRISATLPCGLLRFKLSYRSLLLLSVAERWAVFLSVCWQNIWTDCKVAFQKFVIRCTLHSCINSENTAKIRLYQYHFFLKPIMSTSTYLNMYIITLKTHFIFLKQRVSTPLSFFKQKITRFYFNFCTFLKHETFSLEM